MGEDLPHGDPAGRRAGQEGEVVGQLVVEPEPPVLHQLQHRGGGERLRVGGDAEQVRGGERDARFDVGVPVRRREDEPVLVEDGHLDAGHAIEALPERDPPVEVARRVVDG